MENEKQVDESWKESAFQQDDATDDKPSTDSKDTMEVNFTNYITSLGFQAMIFLGEIPSPMTNKDETNLDQAKFLIDTMSLIKDKTKGNLTKEEDNLLNASVYELQMKYVEKIQAEQNQAE